MNNRELYTIRIFSLKLKTQFARAIMQKYISPCPPPSNCHEKFLRLLAESTEPNRPRRNCMIGTSYERPRGSDFRATRHAPGRLRLLRVTPGRAKSMRRSLTPRATRPRRAPPPGRAITPPRCLRHSPPRKAHPSGTKSSGRGTSSRPGARHECHVWNLR